MRSGALLLVMLIASCMILAVSPIPVKHPPEQRKRPPGGPTIGGRISKFTNNAGKVGPKKSTSNAGNAIGKPESQPNPNQPVHQSEPYRKVVFNYLDGMTGQRSTDGKRSYPQIEQHLVTAIFVNIFHMDPMFKPIFKGTYNPSQPKTRNGVYFSIEGLTIEECPEICFGFYVSGASIQPDGTVKSSGKFRARYAGVSPGEPAPNHFRDELSLGRPIFNKENRLFTEAEGTEWDNRAKEFKATFMQPRVTFIRIDGEPLLPSKYDPELLFHKAINGALLRGPTESIVYHGQCLPLKDKPRQWVYFEFVGRGPCTALDPCLGFIALGAGHDSHPGSYSDNPNIDYFGGNAFSQILYVGIVTLNTDTDTSKDLFKILWKYTAPVPNQRPVPYVWLQNQGWQDVEWRTILRELTEDWKKQLSPLVPRRAKKPE